MPRVSGSFLAKIELPTKKIDAKCQRAVSAAQHVLDAAVQKSMWPFTPYRTGAMQTSLKGQGTGYLRYGVPYDRRTYYGLDTWNWTRVHHAQAGPKWFERAKALDAKKWNETAQTAINKYLERSGQ